MTRKLHIGGQIKADPWELFNIQSGPGVDHVGNAKDMSRFADRSFSEVYVSHVLEHFDYREVQIAVKEWYRILDSEGKLYLSVPDMDVLCKLYENSTGQEKVKINAFMYGGHTDEYDIHHFGFNKQLLTQLIERTGFAKATFVKSFGIFKDSSEIAFQGKRISLNVIAEKEKLAPRILTPMDVSGISKDVFYFMSMPRLSFSDNMFGLVETVSHLQLHGQRDQGVFWEQGMELMLETAIERGFKYGLSIDFDTWYTEFHVIDLYEIMEKNPEFGVLISVQSRRGNSYPISGTFEDPQGDTVLVSKGPFDDTHSKSVDTANFGLTLIRLSELSKLSKPWFEHKPDAKGSWGRGHKDADVHFWIKAKNAGIIVRLAEVYVGHLELKCAFSGPPEEGFKTHIYEMNQLNAGGLPTWAIPRSYRQKLQEPKGQTE